MAATLAANAVEIRTVWHGAVALQVVLAWTSPWVLTPAGEAACWQDF